jgi:hypothetical protein
MAKSSSQSLMTMCQEGARICRTDGCLKGGETEYVERRKRRVGGDRNSLAED